MPLTASHSGTVTAVLPVHWHCQWQCYTAYTGTASGKLNKHSYNCSGSRSTVIALARPGRHPNLNQASWQGQL